MQAPLSRWGFLSCVHERRTTPQYRMAAFLGIPDPYFPSPRWYGLSQFYAKEKKRIALFLLGYHVVILRLARPFGLPALASRTPSVATSVSQAPRENKNLIALVPLILARRFRG